MRSHEVHIGIENPIRPVGRFKNTQECTTFRARLILVNFQQSAAIVVAAVVIMTQDELQPLTMTYFHVNKIRGFHKLTTARQTLILMEIKT